VPGRALLSINDFTGPTGKPTSGGDPGGCKETQPVDCQGHAMIEHAQEVTGYVAHRMATARGGRCSSGCDWMRTLLAAKSVHDTLLSRPADKVICMTYTPDDARTYVGAVRWQFASTMPRVRHWYTIRKWRPDLDDAFVGFVRHIRSVGVRMDWPGPPAKPLYRNQYLLLDGWKYWTMGDPYPGVVPPIETPETTTLINRARIDPQEDSP